MEGLPRTIGVVLLAYLLGSIPFAYLAGWRRGLDIRRLGSRNVGAANIWWSAGKMLAALVFFADLGKGLAAAWLSKSLTRSQEVAAMAALAAIAGHNWPVWLGFNGGRGIATTMGALAVLAPLELGFILIPFAWGAATRNLALGVALGIAALPILSWALGQPPSIILMGAAMLLIMLLRRLTAIGVREEIRGAQDRRRLILNRLLYDNSKGRGFRD